MAIQELIPTAQFDPATFDSITPELRTKAGQLAYAMAEKFDVDDRDFSIVPSLGQDDTPNLTVAYVYSNGVNLGNPSAAWDGRRSWNGIRGRQAIDTDFIVRVGKEKVDTRQGMTEAVYRAVITHVKDRHQALPDRPVAYRDGDGFWFPQTWLTGERAKPHTAPFGVANGSNDQPEVWWTNRRHGNNSILFRPAAILK